MTDYHIKTRFKTPNLTITSALVGREHRFTVDDRRVCVRLPERHEAISSNDDARLRAISWISDTREPTAYDVYGADVFVYANDSTRIDELINRAAMNRPPEKVGKPIGAGGPGTEDLDKAISDFSRIAQSAVHRWFQIAQWQTDYWAVGRTRRERERFGGSLYDANGRRVASGSISIIVALSSPVTEEHWSRIESALSSGEGSPLFSQLYFDGVEHFVDDDLRRAVIDFAIACEVVLKMLVERNTPDALFTAGKNYLLRAQANVLHGQFLESLVGSAWVNQNRQVIKRIERLFKARNETMHEHKRAAMAGDECRVHEATKALLVEGITHL